MTLTHRMKTNDKKYKVNVWTHDSMIGGSVGNSNFPSVYKGDVYMYSDGSDFPIICGSLTGFDFNHAFEPLEGQEVYHQECMLHCESINGK